MIQKQRVYLEQQLVKNKPTLQVLRLFHQLIHQLFKKLIGLGFTLPKKRLYLRLISLRHRVAGVVRRKFLSDDIYSHE